MPSWQVQKQRHLTIPKVQSFFISSSSSSSFITSKALIDPFRPLLIVSSKVFQVVCVHLVYNPALFWTFCCCSFLLHVVANLIWIFLVLVTGYTFNSSKISSLLLWSKLCILLFSWKISSQIMLIGFYPFAWGSKFRFHLEEWASRTIIFGYLCNAQYYLLPVSVFFALLESPLF
jgi:hypothetical protein